MARKLKLETIVRRVIEAQMDGGRIKAIKLVRKARPGVGLKEAKDFADWIDGQNDGEVSYGDLADMWCEEHWTPYDHAHATKFHVARVDEVENAVVKPDPPKPKPQPKPAGQRSACEAIFGADWMRVLTEKMMLGRPGFEWINRKVEAWGEEQDRIAAYNYLNSMDSLALLHTEFPGVKK